MCLNINSAGIYSALFFICHGPVSYDLLDITRPGGMYTAYCVVIVHRCTMVARVEDGLIFDDSRCLIAALVGTRAVPVFFARAKACHDDRTEGDD